ncbi:hypothetical protein CLU79DRAFT_341655 [Phycomyces nitens]|nr:hypothetical protein CLU79DRAFT_341655 [Phycomyces nitens]
MNPSGFQIPRRRANDSPSPSFPKRRRTEGSDQLLHTLFEKLNQEPLLEDIWAKEEKDLESNDNGQDNQPIAAVASQFLDKEVSERLVEALSRNDTSDEVEPPSTRCFFTLPIGEWPMDSKDGAGLEKAKFIHGLSQTTQGRSFMMESGCLKHWHKRGWECPRSLYRYVFDIVAFEPNKVVANQAYFTILSLWNYLKVKTNVLYAEYPAGCIEPSWVINVFESYGYAPKDTTDGLISDQTSESTVPQASLGWIIELFGMSIKLWPSAYRKDIPRILDILLNVSLDPVSRPVFGSLQTAIQNCLGSLDDKWKTTLAELNFDKHWTEYQVLYCTQVIPPTTERGIFLQQRLAAHGLGLSRDRQELEDVLKHIDDPSEIYSASQPDYSLLGVKVRLVDIVIGSDEDILDLEKDNLQLIIHSLQLLSRRIGGRLGALKRTVANECIQRLWNRLAYTIGRDERVLEDHQV